jgi:Dyp-type peroxidase family
VAASRLIWRSETVRIEDVQGLILRGYGMLHASRYLALRIDDARGARAWLREIADEVTPAATPIQTSSRHMNVAFTHAGLERLGLPAAALEDFRSAFVSGVHAPAQRSRALGDVGRSAPDRWRWGNAERPIHVALLLFAADAARAAEFARSHRDRLAKHGLSVVEEFDTNELPGRKEHFGFRDGIAQPALRNANPEGRRPGVLELDGYAANRVELGEFLFGHRNEYGAVAHGPRIDAALDPQGFLPVSSNSDRQRDFARDGSFMVWRQLEEHVAEFWSAIRQSCEDDPAARRWLAAKCIGRWPSGAPLALAPEIDDPTLADANGFAYARDDPYGHRTPLGSHIRRGNPRDWHLSDSPRRARRIANAHRIIRRARPYGERLAASMEPEDMLRARPDAVERGVHFVCFMADIERQFELIQATWLNAGKFGGLYDEIDPVLGAAPESGGVFTLQATPLRQRLGDLSRFVTVRGAAYLFMPSIPALRFLGALSE